MLSNYSYDELCSQIDVLETEQQNQLFSYLKRKMEYQSFSLPKFTGLNSVYSKTQSCQHEESQEFTFITCENDDGLGNSLVEDLKFENNQAINKIKDLRGEIERLTGITENYNTACFVISEKDNLISNLRSGKNSGNV